MGNGIAKLSNCILFGLLSSTFDGDPIEQLLTRVFRLPETEIMKLIKIKMQKLNLYSIVTNHRRPCCRHRRHWSTFVRELVEVTHLKQQFIHFKQFKMNIP
jgi:hypothetical protein